MTEERLNTARVATLFTLARPAYATTVALAGILVVALWAPYAAPLLLGWFALICAVTLVRIGLHLRFVSAAPGGRNPLQWENRFAFGALVSGAVWAFAGMVFFPESDPILQVAVVMVIGGVVVGAVALYASSLKALYAFGTLPLATLILQLLAQACQCVAQRRLADPQSVGGARYVLLIQQRIEC